jgi:hypothetical protein
VIKLSHRLVGQGGVLAGALFVLLLPVAAVAQTPVIVAAAPPNWIPLLNAAISGAATIVGVVVTYLVAVYVPRGIAAVEARTGVQVTDQQRAAIYAAINTAAGVLQTKLDTGALLRSEIAPNSPAVTAEAMKARASVPDAVVAQNTSLETISRKIVATVDTSPKPTVLFPAAMTTNKPPTPEVVAAKVPVDRVERTPFSFPKE